MKREREELPAEGKIVPTKRPCLDLLHHLVEERDRQRMELMRVSKKFLDLLQPYSFPILQLVQHHEEELDLSQERLEEPYDSV